MAVEKTEKPYYEFGGPPGATALVFGLPVLLMIFGLTCNDISGCPAPALLSPSTLTWDNLKTQIPWPENGAAGLVSWKVTGVLVGWYLFSMILDRILPAQHLEGVKLAESGKSLKYRFNAFNVTVAQLAICAVGTYIQGANFIVWTFLDENYLQLLTTSIIGSYLVSTIVYVQSFSVQHRDPTLRELAVGGNTGVLIYDYWIGRELNPRWTVPILGEFDVKTWLEMRPALLGWVLFNLAAIAKQYRLYGTVSDSMLLTAAAQIYYVLEGQFFEAGLLRMMDVVTDGLGFMLTFGNMVWVPFLYSTQCRYLAVHPVHLGWTHLSLLAGLYLFGLYIFRSSNDQRALFRSKPDDPRVKDLPYLETKRGTRLLTGGWWGMSRHMNYLGDWIQSLPFSLPTGMAGYVILTAGSVAQEVEGGAAADVMADGRIVVQGDAKGWGMIYTYCYAMYFASLLVMRERRDDKSCEEKYGDDWEKYKKIVPYRIVPGVY